MSSKQKTQLEERKYWYRCEDDQLMCRVLYREGGVEGEFRFWYENGRLNERSFYRDGRREHGIKTDCSKLMIFT
jgi:antitoxin component YwqK of YwqJK toxin-antitoxin module